VVQEGVASVAPRDVTFADALDTPIPPTTTCEAAVTSTATVRGKTGGRLGLHGRVFTATPSPR